MSLFRSPFSSRKSRRAQAGGLFAAAFAAPIVASAAFSAGIPAEVLFPAAPRVQGYYLSSDGSSIIVVRGTVGKTVVDVMDTGSGRLRGLDRHSFAFAGWGEAANVMYAFDKERKIFRVTLLESGERIEPFEVPVKWSVARLPTLTDPFLIVREGNNLHRCDLRRNCEILSRGRRGVRKWLLTRDGQVAARFRSSPAGYVVFESAGPAGSWRRVFSIDSGTTLATFGPVERDGSVWAISNRHRDRVALVKLDARTGEETVVHAHDRFDIRWVAMLFERDGSRPLLAAADPDYQTFQYLDARTKGTFDAFVEKIGAPSRLRVKSATRRYAIVEVVNEKLVRAFYLLDLDAGDSRELWTSPIAEYRDEFASTRPVTIRARDGRTIYGYLTLPPGRRGPVPMVLILHGGPREREVWSFHSGIQFLATRGYAVFRLNYRGSSGYNRDYWRAGNGEVFGAVVDDVLDAADWAISAGHTARDRIALFGGSFGGFLTLAVMAREPGAFGAGIAINAITDAVEFWRKEWRNGRTRITSRHLFESSDFPEELLARESPLNNYRNIMAPLLLIAGGKDKKVPPTHSRKMFDLLKEDGRDIQFVEYENAGHALKEREVRIRMYEATHAFLRKRLEADAP